MQEISRLNKLLEADNQNVKESMRALMDIEPMALQCIEYLINTFDDLNNLFGKACQYNKHHGEINRWAKQMGLIGNEALYLLQDSILIGRPVDEDKTEDAKRSLTIAISIIARVQLSMRLGRDFLFGMTDLLRLRITSSLGYLRIQSETAAILYLCIDHPEIGNDWLKSVKEENERSFYKKWHNKKIIPAIKNLNLYHDYNRGSNISLHSRAGGTTMGFSIGEKYKKRAEEILLVYREIDDANLLFIWFGILLRFHRKILLHSNEFYPEINILDIKNSRLSKFLELELIIWEKTKEKHSSLKPGSRLII